MNRVGVLKHHGQSNLVVQKQYLLIKRSEPKTDDDECWWLLITERLIIYNVFGRWGKLADASMAHGPNKWLFHHASCASVHCNRLRVAWVLPICDSLADKERKTTLSDICSKQTRTALPQERLARRLAEFLRVAQHRFASQWCLWMGVGSTREQGKMGKLALGSQRLPRRSGDPCTFSTLTTSLSFLRLKLQGSKSSI